MELTFLEETKNYINKTYNDVPSKEDIIKQVNSSNSPFPINSKFIFSLYYTCELLDESYANVLKPFKLTPPQVEILQTLYISKDKKLIQNKIEQQTFSSKATISAQLKKLENKQLIKRKQNPKNKRQNLVTITKKGEELLNEVSKKLTPMIKTPLITEEEADILIKILQKIRNETSNKN